MRHHLWWKTFSNSVVCHTYSPNAMVSSVGIWNKRFSVGTLQQSAAVALLLSRGPACWRWATKWFDVYENNVPLISLRISTQLTPLRNSGIRLSRKSCRVSHLWHSQSRSKTCDVKRLRPNVFSYVQALWSQLNDRKPKQLVKSGLNLHNDIYEWEKQGKGVRLLQQEQRKMCWVDWRISGSLKQKKNKKTLKHRLITGQICRPKGLGNTLLVDY